MTIAIAQFIWTDVTTSATSSVLATGTTYNALFNPLGAGNTVEIYSLSNFGSQTSVTDTQGNTYNLRATAQSTAGPGNQKLYRYVAKNIVGGSNTITLNLPAAQTVRPMLLVEYSGVAVSPEDGTNANDQASPTTGANLVVSGTATNANQPALITSFSMPIFSNSQPAAGTSPIAFTSSGTAWSASTTGRHETARITASGSAVQATFTATAGTTEHLTVMGILDELAAIYQPFGGQAGFFVTDTVIQ